MADGQPLDDHVGVALRRAYQHAVANLTARIARFDLSPLEFSVLVRLHDADGPRMFEQQAYVRERDGRIGWMRVVCTGKQPLG